MDIYVLPAEFTHLLALIILLYKFYVTKSAKGVSGKTHILYVLVYITRCSDLSAAFIADATGPMMIMFILLTFYNLFVIYFQFRAKADKEDDVCRIEVVVICCAILGGVFSNEFINPGIMQKIYVMSFFLEAVALVPQMILIIKQGRFESYVLPYLMFLGCYRVFHLLEWISIGMMYNNDITYSTLYCSVLQTFLCAFFLCVYYFYIKDETGNKNNYASKLPQVITNETLLEKQPSSDLPGVFAIGSKQKCEQFKDDIATNV